MPKFSSTSEPKGQELESVVGLAKSFAHPDRPLGSSHLDAALDEALAESFPASDPVAIGCAHPVKLPGEKPDLVPMIPPT